jgi:hypothetical protein
VVVPSLPQDVAISNAPLAENGAAIPAITGGDDA